MPLLVIEILLLEPVPPVLLPEERDLPHPELLVTAATGAAMSTTPTMSEGSKLCIVAFFMSGGFGPSGSEDICCTLSAVRDKGV